LLLAELFKRMVFNALISNADDHPRNHALIAPTSSWELSPAFNYAGFELDPMRVLGER
jgi:serine/threonine-protein kinase HipA